MAEDRLHAGHLPDVSQAGVLSSRLREPAGSAVQLGEDVARAPFGGVQIVTSINGEFAKSNLLTLC